MPEDLELLILRYLLKYENVVTDNSRTTVYWHVYMVRYCLMKTCQFHINNSYQILHLHDQIFTIGSLGVKSHNTPTSVIDVTDTT